MQDKKLSDLSRIDVQSTTRMEMYVGKIKLSF